MKKKLEDWEYVADTPEQFDIAIKNAVSQNEKEFFEKLRYKVLNEIAASNEVLLKDDENDDAIYILRVGTDDIMVGHNLTVAGKEHDSVELAGVCFAMSYDLYDFLGYHITLQEWLRKRDYQGIRYDRNNDNL
jgi:glycerol-3-phosphate cytidylyltransferase-like family protein